MRSSFTRPQGLDPSASPLRVVGVAADVPPDTPLGFSHRGPATDPRWTVRIAFSLRPQLRGVARAVR
jgi:hypothetical protein